MTTPKEFDYDLWKTADGKFHARIKRTGDICEVSAEVFRTLHNEAMAMYRDQQGIPIYTVRNGKSVLVGRAPLLHLGYDTGDGELGDVWAVEPTQTEVEYATVEMEQTLRALLTPKQLEVYHRCLLEGMSYTQFGAMKGIRESAVRKTVKQIRKKTESIFGGGCE